MTGSKNRGQVRRCELSGKIVGIGFSLGGELQAAYDCMLFSMAVDKVFYYSLFGARISAHDFAGCGRGREVYFDRGPAAAKGFHPDDSHMPHIVGLSPSFSPMSNATIEGSHPKDWKIFGKNYFVESSFTAPQLIKRELLRVLANNQTMDVSDRKIDGRTFGSPNELWAYLDGKGRNLAEPIAFDAAVRTYLTRKDFPIKADGLYLYGSRFDSKALRATGVLSKADARITRTLPGFIVDYGVGRAWIDIKGRLVEVMYTPETRTHESLLYPTLMDLEQKAKNAADTMRDFAEHRAAASGEIRARFKEDTGKSWDSGIARSGKRNNKSVAARQQTADMKKYSRSKAA